jgi:hypothetical protein
LIKFNKLNEERVYIFSIFDSPVKIGRNQRLVEQPIPEITTSWLLPEMPGKTSIPRRGEKVPGDRKKTSS